MEISVFRARKLAQRFRVYDGGGDGYIGREDFELAANRIAEEFGHAPDSPARQRPTEASRKVWQHLAMVADADQDGKIGEAEFKAAFSAGLLETPESYGKGYVVFLNAVWDVVDTDGDGRLNFDEFFRMARTMVNLPESQARKEHREADADGDGYITRQEWLGLVHEFYFAEDPESVGG